MERTINYYNSFLNGDEDALSMLIHAYRDGLMLYINGYVKNISVAEELTEETFVKLVLKRPKFYERSAFKTWLYAIARNLTTDYLRRNKNQEVSLQMCAEIALEEKHLENSYICSEQNIQLHNAIKKLKAEYAQVLWLIYFEQFTHKEVAKIMRKSVHNVDTLVYRARQALKAILYEEGFVYEKL